MKPHRVNSRQRPTPVLRAALLILLAATGSLRADIALAPLFRDGAVLQRDTPVPVWGFARPGENVVVRFGPNMVATTAGQDGRWFVRLPAQSVSTTPTELIAEGSNRLVVRDVLVGDVWLCGGQSNMLMAVRSVRDADQEIAAARHPLLRFFKVATQFASAPAETVKGEWQATTPESIGAQSAAAYFFGRELVAQLGVPVGLVVSSYGNTPIATWRSPAALAGDDVVASWWQRQQQNTPPPRPHRQPSSGHHGMIAPLVPYAVRGFLWYQGEADATESRDLAPHYAAQFTGLIRDWRLLFGAGEPLPFYWVQLAGYGRAAPRDWTGVREQQTRALALPATGQAIALDLGDATDIHPKNKQAVGARLARLALHRTYGHAISDTGPVPQSAEPHGASVVIRFDSAVLQGEGDLATTFELAGTDGTFHRVDQAAIDGNTVTLTAQSVPRPVAVRFGWQDLSAAFLFNSDRLPAAPFHLELPASR